MSVYLLTEISHDGTEVSLPNLANGVYIVSAHFNSGIFKEKLIISK
jgi:hypothetical protein